MTTLPWKDRLAEMVRVASDEAIRQSVESAGTRRLYATFTPSDVATGEWGTIHIITAGDSLPAGHEYISQECFPRDRPWHEWHSWLSSRMGRVPIIGS